MIIRRWLRASVAPIVLAVGACGADPDPAGIAEEPVTGCSLAGPVTVASGLQSPIRSLEVDDQSVYFIQHPLGQYRVDKNGGPVSLPDYGLPEQRGLRTFDLAIDDDFIYLMYEGLSDIGGVPGAGVLLYDKDGTPRTGIGARGAGADCQEAFLSEIAVVDGNLYWLERDAPGPNIREPDPDCVREVDGAIVGIAAGSTTQVLLTRPKGRSGRALIADAFHVFWADDAGIWRVPVGGGAAELLDATTNAQFIAIDADNLYFTTGTPPDYADGRTYRVSAPLQTTQILDRALISLRSDGTSLFGTVRRNLPGAQSNVIRLKPNGHGQVTLGKAMDNRVAIDDTYVYSLDPTGTKIVKFCK